MADFFFVVNPRAANGKVGTKIWPQLRARLEASGTNFDFEMTTGRGDGIEIARLRRARNYKCYIAVGGDGTVNEMLNGLLSAGDTSPPVVSVFPVGSGNDFARMHHIPDRIDEWLRILLAFKTRRHNAGIVHYHDDSGIRRRRYFVNVAGLFYDAFVVKAVNGRTKPINSSIQYLAVAVKKLWAYRPAGAVIDWDEGRISGHFYSVNIGICQYSGGGMQFVPHADPSATQLAVTVARRMHPLRVLLSTPYFYNGKVARHRRVDCFHTEKLSIRPTDGAVHLETDGEFIGYAPCRFELARDAFRLVVP